MYKKLGIILGIIGIFFLGSVYLVNNNLNKSILENIEKDDSIKEIKSVDCHILKDECQLSSISFNDSNATIDNVKFNGLLDLIMIQVMNDVSENKEFNFKLSFNGVKNALTNNEYTKFMNSSINDSMDYLFDLKFSKNNDFYNSNLLINLKQDELIIVSHLSGLLNIDKDHVFSPEKSSLNKFKLEIKDPKKQLLSIIHQSYINEVNESGIELVHHILGIPNKKEVIDESTLEAAIVLSLMEFYKENNLETLLVTNPSLSNIRISLIEEKNIETFLLNSESSIDLLKSFELFLH